MSFLETATWFWTKGIIAIVCIIIILIILSIDSCVYLKTYQHFKEKGKLLMILPIFIYIGNLITLSAVVMDDFQLLPSISCLTWTQIGMASYLITKCILYLLLIFRSHTIYKETIYAYNPKLLSFFAIIIIVYTVIISIFTALSISVEITYHNDIRICDGGPDILYVGIVVLVDLIVSILTLYLFLRPLNILLTQQRKFKQNLKLQMVESNTNQQTQSEETANDENDEIECNSPSPTNEVNNDEDHVNYRANTDNTDQSDDGEQEFEGLMIRVSTLTFVMILTTFVSLVLVGIFNATVIASIDACINCICVMMYNNQYQDIFDKLCCIGVSCTKICAHYCCCCAYHENGKNQKHGTNKMHQQHEV